MKISLISSEREVASGYDKGMNLLVTAGNTLVPIDRVRCITNIFTGRTGASIALHCHGQGHVVTLLTSHPEVVREMQDSAAADTGRWKIHDYRTFQDLHTLMERLVRNTRLDAIIHSAAVSDYDAAGIYAPAPGTSFCSEERTWEGKPPALEERAAAKVKSDEAELWLRLIRTPKLIDSIRADWHFPGVLVKFKLEVGISDVQLLEIAERSRTHSRADLMVANTLEGAGSWAYLGPIAGDYQRLSRRELPERLLAAVEHLHKERRHG